MKKKRCSKCEEVKPLDEFNRVHRDQNERRHACRSCEHDHQKRRGLKIPQDSEHYELTQITMHNHMYLHFGWWEPRMTAIERHQQRRDVKKYYTEELKTEYKKDK